MKFTLYGKVISRSCRRVKKTDGTAYDLYNMVIEEPGQFPSRFQVSSKDASLFGPTDGPLAVGKFVTANGFVNGKEKEVTAKDGKKINVYSTWLTVRSIEPYAPVDDPKSEAAQPTTGEDDLPY